MPASADMPRRTLDSMHHVPLTRAEMTHRIGRFYSGRPSWRTRLRSLRRRLGDGSLPLSEEEELIEVKQKILVRNRAQGRAEKPIYAMRLALPLPRVLLAADGRTTFRYVKALKNASTSILNMLLEITGEAAYHHWDPEEHLMRASPRQFKKLPGQSNRMYVAINEHRPPIHYYLRGRRFSPEPHADIRFCVVRDPVERFLSGVRQIQLMRLQRGKCVMPVTATFIDKRLDALAALYAATDNGLRRKNRGIAAGLIDRHILRQTEFLGKDAAWYTHIFSTRQPQEFHDFLSHLAGRRLSSFDANSLASRQKILRAHGPSLARPQLTAAQRRKVEDLYAEDYQVFGRWF